MRSITTKALTLGLLGAAALAWAGCEPAKQTQYVAGISTQVQVPRDLKTVRVDVTVGGIVTFCQAYPVFDGKVLLPKSLGTYPVDTDKIASPVTVSVVGFTDSYDEGNAAMGSCTSTAPKVGSNGIRVLRRSRQPYLKDQTLFLPMGLKFGCYDTDCETGGGEEKTCKAGRCLSAATDTSTLVPFSPELLDGSGGGCFHLDACMEAGVPPAVVNGDDCTYAIPNTASAPLAAAENPIKTPGEGLNVEVTYDGGSVVELLDLDKDEGFFVPDPAKPQQFRLAPGLCDQVKGFGPDPQKPNETRETPHRITGVRASALCAPKRAHQPICSTDALKRMGTDANGQSLTSSSPDKCQARELKPSPSALVILSDDTQGNKDLFEDATAGLSFIQTALKDPAFANTEIALAFYPGSNDACTVEANPITIRGNARAKQTEIFDGLRTHAVRTVAGEAPKLDGQLKDVYAFLQTPEFQAYNKRGVLVLGNRKLNPAVGPQNTCSATPASLADAALKSSAPVQTYALLLTYDPAAPKDKADPAQVSAFNEATALALAGGSPGAYDARGGNSEKAPAFDALRKITADLATCVYDVPKAGKFTTDSTLAYTDAVAVPAKPAQKIPFNGACASETSSASGWNFTDGSQTRIRVCGQACTDYRSVLSTAQQYAALYLKPSQAVPMFWYNNPCSP